MISRIHQKLGTAGFVISIVALVAALGGGAYAASGGLTGKQKKEVEKIAKRYAGKPGATGATGPAGAAGPAGAKGDTGAKGDPGTNGTAGSNGTNGTNGANGKSVALVNEEPAGCEAEGLTGYTYEVEGSGNPNEVCSSVAGGSGLPKTLGPEEMETGTWATNILEEAEYGFTPISFTVPLGAELDGSHVVIVGSSGTPPTECTFGAGTPSVSNPQARPGYLCVFEGTLLEAGPELSLETIQKPNIEFALGAATSGAVLKVFNEGTTSGQISGTWAVTGELAQ